MTTSGTVAQTTLDTATVLEHAFRRCRVHPSQQTPETISIAKSCLYLLLTHMSALGINLWAVEKKFVGCVDGQGVYVCPTGTVDLLNIVYSQPTRATGTDTTAATNVITQLTSSTSIVRVGILLTSVTASDTLVISSSTDGVSYTTRLSETKTDWAANTWYWFDLDPAIDASYFKAAFTNATTFDEFYLASAVYDLPMTPWNRDTWAAINNKTQQGRPSVSYFFEKLIAPQITAWPVPNNDYDHLTMWVHRYVQDVGTLTQTLELPARWYETIIWQLALRLCFELPVNLVPTDTVAQVKGMADQYTFEASDEEADGLPFFLSPSIRVYTR